MIRLVSLVVLFLPCLIAVPAYAEVTSLQTDRPLYAIDMNVYFTGTVDSADSQKLVNLLIKDPNGKIILMTGKFAAINDAFQITINTNDPSQFYLKGTYQATAYVDSASNGKTIFFDFSPNGSPVTHSTTPQNGINSSNAVGNDTLSKTSEFKQHEFVLHENMNITDTGNTSKSIPLITSNVKQSSNEHNLETIVYPAMIVCGVGIVGLIAYRKMKMSKAESGQSKKSIHVIDGIDNHEDYALAVLKNRLARGEITIEEFKAMKDALDEP